jgi:PAS domain-containing protein
MEHGVNDMRGERYATALDAIRFSWQAVEPDEAIMLLDADGCLLRATPAARSLLGLEPEYDGRQWVDNVEVWMPVSERQPWLRAVSSGVDEEEFALLSGPRGRWLTRIVAMPVTGVAGAVIGVVVTFGIQGEK